jgi:hypothetical protein
MPKRLKGRKDKKNCGKKLKKNSFLGGGSEGTSRQAPKKPKKDGFKKRTMISVSKNNSAEEKRTKYS